MTTVKPQSEQQKMVLNMGRSTRRRTRAAHFAGADGETVSASGMGYLIRESKNRARTKRIPRPSRSRRMDYLIAGEQLVYCLAGGKTAGLEIPKRAQYIR